MYIPKHFELYELLSKDLYEAVVNRYGHERPWEIFFDGRILVTADRLRTRYGKMVANTWHWGGHHQYRGYRPVGCQIGAKFSQHKFGRAIDLIPSEVTLEEIWNDMDTNPSVLEFQYVTCCERDITWLHVDCRNWNKWEKGIKLIYP